MNIKLYNCDSRELSGDILVLEIESPKIFHDVLLDIIDKQFPAREILIEDNGIELSSKDIICISDFLNFDVSSKNISTKIYKHVEKLFINDIEKRCAFENTTNDFAKNICQMLLDINIDFCYAEEIDLKDVLSMIKLSPLVNDEEDILDKLCQYANIISELKLFKVLALVNLKSYLNNDEISILYKHCLYKNVKLLIIEAYHKEKLLQNEKKILIDKEFCDRIYE